MLVRVRPANEKERFANRFCVDVDDEKRAVLLANRAENKTAHFVYDQVTGRDGTQAGIFESVGKPMCESVLQGYNCCVFAYGQTGAGKTFTMMGDGADSEDAHSRGLIQRVFDHLFTRIAELQEGESKIDVTCTCSYLEIYNEQVTDLLSQGQGSGSPPIIRDDPKTRSIVIEGAVKTPVKSSADTLQALTLGQQNRKVAATNMNKESSRSHCVFTLYLQSSCVSDGVTSRRFSRFNLIDLAGSERQKQTQATGDRLKEANNINRSLSALGNVIMSLANNNGHVPYRDSKLTFMLKVSCSVQWKGVCVRMPLHRWEMMGVHLCLPLFSPLPCRGHSLINRSAPGRTPSEATAKRASSRAFLRQRAATTRRCRHSNSSDSQNS